MKHRIKEFNETTKEEIIKEINELSIDNAELKIEFVVSENTKMNLTDITDIFNQITECMNSNTQLEFSMSVDR